MINKWLTLTLTVISILIPGLLYYVSTTDKKLSYEIVSSSSIINRSEAIDGISVWYDSQVVENINLTNLRLINDGSEPIRSMDFENPIIIDFDSETKLLRVNLRNEVPDNLKVDFTVEGNQVRIKPLLLNPEDGFDIEILSTDKSIPLPHARIAGVKEITKIDNKPNNSIINYLSLFCAFLLIVLYGRLLGISFIENNFRWSFLMIAVLSGMSAALLLRGQFVQFGLFEEKTYLMVYSTIAVLLGTFPSMLRKLNELKRK